MEHGVLPGGLLRLLLWRMEQELMRGDPVRFPAGLSPEQEQEVREKLRAPVPDWDEPDQLK